MEIQHTVEHRTKVQVTTGSRALELDAFAAILDRQLDNERPNAQRDRQSAVRIPAASVSAEREDRPERHDASAQSSSAKVVVTVRGAAPHQIDPDKSQPAPAEVTNADAQSQGNMAVPQTEGRPRDRTSTDDDGLLGSDETDCHNNVADPQAQFVDPANVSMPGVTSVSRTNAETPSLIVSNVIQLAPAEINGQDDFQLAESPITGSEDNLNQPMENVALEAGAAPATVTIAGEIPAMTLIAAEMVLDRSSFRQADTLAAVSTMSHAANATVAAAGVPVLGAMETTEPVFAPSAGAQNHPQTEELRKSGKGDIAAKPAPTQRTETTSRDPAQLIAAAQLAGATRLPTAAVSMMPAAVSADYAAWSGSAPFGDPEYTTFPGWSVQLGQGAPGKRHEFLSTLRQQLKDLPTHEQVSIQMQRAMRDGAGRITIQLQPAELGRIHVHMEIDEEKRVSATIVAERPATLDLLQRDARLLERALQDAGLKLDTSGMSFGLTREDAEKGDGGAHRSWDSTVGISKESEATADNGTELELVDVSAGLLNVRV